LADLALITFDLDGTLVDSRRDIAEAANDLLTECGAPSLPEQTIGRMVGDGAATLVARAFAAVEFPPPDDALRRFLRIYGARLLVHTQPYDGVPAALGTLARRYALAVLTNKPIEATRRILEGLDLARYFDPDLVLGGDGPHPRKPQPDGLRALADRARARAPQTMLVGDSIVDWRTAHAAGAISCIARYGFGFEGFPLEQLEPGDLVIEKALDLTAML
jgi:phosphoglycolate phosphatase